MTSRDKVGILLTIILKVSKVVMRIMIMRIGYTKKISFRFIWRENYEKYLKELVWYLHNLVLLIN